jgi:hypothetical protein
MSFSMKEAQILAIFCAVTFPTIAFAKTTHPYRRLSGLLAMLRNSPTAVG